MTPSEVDFDNISPFRGRCNFLESIPGYSEECVDQSVIGPRMVYEARKERAGGPPPPDLT